MNYYRRYSGDYLRDTSRLSMLEHGAYSLMLDYYYSEGKPLPPDVDEVYTMVRAMKTADRAAVDKILERYFDKREDGYHNGRADEELALAAPLIEASRVNGKKGGRRKNPPDNPTGSGEGCPPGYDEETHNGTQQDAAGIPDGQHPPSSNHHTPTTTPQPPLPIHQERSSAEARASRLPKNWELPSDWGEWALQERTAWAAARVTLEAAKFKDHWLAKAGKDGRKLDWPATWRNWVRNSRDDYGKAHADRNKQAAEEWLNSGSIDGEARRLDG